jgi:hypothetical protein
MSAADKLDRASELILQQFMSGMERAALIVESAAKRNLTPKVDEGILRASMEHEVELEPSRIRATVGSNKEYAPYVHQGTGIYAVDGKGRKTPWSWKGESKKWAGWHRTVGVKPTPFLKKAVEDNKERITETLRDSQRGGRV